MVVAASLVSLAAGQEVSWSIPEDGGTPRSKDRIERIEANEFRIQASFEEGGQSVLRHAVSRVDLICSNGAAQPATVTVHFDLSGDGKRIAIELRREGQEWVAELILDI